MRRNVLPNIAHASLVVRDWTGRQFIARAVQLAPGIALSLTIAAAGIELAQWHWFQVNGIGALTLAILVGMVAGNTIFLKPPVIAEAGVTYSKQTLLKLGIILYGMRLTFADIGHVGWRGVAIDVTVIASTFALAWLLGTRVLGLDRETAMLVGAGSAICGAAAVMATEPVVRARPEQVAIAVSTVVVFGTIAIFLYPALYRLDLYYQVIPMSNAAYGLFAGSTIHEVAQVVAAGHAVDDKAASIAVIAKLVRVLMLAPFLVTLSAILSRSTMTNRHSLSTVGTKPRANPIVIPWFAIGFIAVAGLNSLALLPKAAVAAITDIDNLLLATAMAALGLTTHASSIRHAGLKPLVLAAALFVWLVVGGLVINLVITR